MDLKNPLAIKFKAFLFLLIVLISSGLLIFENPQISTVLLLGIALWAACRCYYFAFYVLQHYVDPNFHYSGLWAMVRYLLQKRREP